MPALTFKNLLCSLFLSLFLNIAWAQKTDWDNVNEQYIEARDNGYSKKALSLAKEAFTIAKNKEIKHLPISCFKLGSAYYNQGYFKHADGLLRNALFYFEKLYGAESFEAVATLNLIARNYGEQGQYQKAEYYALKSLTLFDKKHRKDETMRIPFLVSLGTIYRDQNKYIQAKHIYLEAQKILNKDSIKNLGLKADLYTNFAALYQAMGNYTECELMYREALALDEQLHGKEHPNVAITLNNMASFYIQQELNQKAIPLLLRAIKIHEQHTDSKNYKLSKSLSHLGLAYEGIGEYEKARIVYERDLAIKRAIHISGPDYATSLNNLAQLYQQQGRYIEAEKLFLESLEIDQGFVA